MRSPLLFPGLLAAACLGGTPMPPIQYASGNRNTKRRTGIRQYNSSFELRVRESQVSYAKKKQAAKYRRRAYTGGH